jgi:hypothetical protein
MFPISSLLYRAAHGNVLFHTYRLQPNILPAEGRLQIVRQLALARAWQMFSIKGEIVNILGFAGHMVSVATIQICS